MLYPHFIHPLDTVIKKILLIGKTSSQNATKCFAILKKKVACDRLNSSLRSTYLLQSEFQTIIPTLEICSKLTIKTH